jgi:hypothetical protein
MIFNFFSEVREWALERNIYDKEFNESHHIANVLEEVTEGMRASDEHGKVDWAVDAMIYLTNYLEHKGYDARLCCAEGLAEIQSRTGAYCDKEKKWKKFTTDEAKARWYTASFDKCKRVSK